MILGIGTDIVEIKRLEHWQQLPDERLQRVFTQNELAYCKDTNGLFKVERLAARFAAKEAFYKALCTTLIYLEVDEKLPPFLTIAPLVEIQNHVHGTPGLKIHWEKIIKNTKNQLPTIHTHLSLTHEKQYALAFVTIEKI